MRLVAYRQDGAAQLGVMRDDKLHHLGAFPATSDAFARLADDVANASLVLGDVVTGDIAPAMPVTGDARIICIGLNYAEHAREGGSEPPSYPAFFVRVDTSLAPSGASVSAQGVSDKLD